jgi:hypothetical protein
MMRLQNKQLHLARELFLRAFQIFALFSLSLLYGRKMTGVGKNMQRKIIYTSFTASSWYHNRFYNLCVKYNSRSDRYGAMNAAMLSRRRRSSAPAA